MKFADLVGVGNAIVDIPVSISLEALNDLKLPLGSSCLVTSNEQSETLKKIGHERVGAQVYAAGAVANSVITVAELYGKAAFIGRVANDHYGQQYVNELSRLKVYFGNPFVVSGDTGTCLVLITPDGERTMRTALGVAAEIVPEDIDPTLIRISKWLFVEAYFLADGDSARETLFQAVAEAKALHSRHRTQVALTFSDADIAKKYKNDLERILPYTDLVFANKNEATAFTGAESPEDALNELRQSVKNVIVTASAKGAHVYFDGQYWHVPARVCTPIDSTGAGDAFAGGFIYGITNGFSPEQAANGGAALAAKVIQHRGPRLVLRRFEGEPLLNI